MNSKKIHGFQHVPNMIAVEVIEANEVVEAVEVIEAAEVPDAREITQYVKCKQFLIF